MTSLISPVGGRVLHHDTPHSLADGAGERWPVVDGIPYLRTGRAELVANALAHLDAGRGDAALTALLADQDDWWTGPATNGDELHRLVRERDTLTLREAMELLRFGPVADYFAYRWSDPTFLAGLALLEAHWAEPGIAFELACGIGHYLRELTQRGVACTGADVVFAKCWLAKHWVAPAADYLVFDAAAPWPIADATFDLVMCHDAFYFLPEQERNAGRLRAAVAPGGVLAVSHLHNSGFRAGARGPAKSADAWASLFPACAAYDENDLLRALARAETPRRRGWVDDPATEAFSLVEGAHDEARPVAGGVAMPIAGAPLRRNPLLGDVQGPEEVRWPSELYRDEYGPGCLWAVPDDELGFDADPVRLRRLVDLPERW